VKGAQETLPSVIVSADEQSAGLILCTVLQAQVMYFVCIYILYTCIILLYTLRR
jgi:hypothetical protein